MAKRNHTTRETRFERETMRQVSRLQHAIDEMLAGKWGADTIQTICVDRLLQRANEYAT